ncbi:protease-4 [Larkinella arboricola]|uniref:Protease-4 n=1 Tax=Larkinella arboricola TaxID=643671 RepID=A0A327WQH8_LARAB|nr:S49 family peptidase [Larkinella arboricola]RAJ94219.1 protease-4 [Larkinella arboricola]
MLDVLLSSQWALNPTYHDRMAGLALGRIQQGFSPFEITQDKKQPFVVSGDDEGIQIGASYGYDRLTKAEGVSGNVVVLPMLGAITRYGDLCSWGAEDYAQWIIEANQDKAVSAMVLEINGPGGSVDGIEMLGEVIRNSQKPIYAFVAGWAASAHYWIASQTRGIMMESKTTSSVGSIGVLAFHVDASKFYEDAGLKVSIIRSDGSDHKARFNDVEPLTEELVTEIKGELNLIRETFIAKVKAGRPGVDESVFSGKMYPGQEAIKLKLADRIGYLGDAIAWADEMAQKAT